MRAHTPAHIPRTSTHTHTHTGDGNLHLNVSCPAYDPAVAQLLEPYVYEWTQRHQGSISAEHGLGIMKAPHIHYSKSPEAIAWMRRIKDLFDPRGILNPCKFVDPLPYHTAAATALPRPTAAAPEQEPGQSTHV